jgi:hypothetical protein
VAAATVGHNDGAVGGVAGNGAWEVDCGGGKEGAEERTRVQNLEDVSYHRWLSAWGVLRVDQTLRSERFQLAVVG